ncbi:MAG TPA: hypothetical protein VGP14_07800 [Casimicrobiaceae bacterium]|nr:hypothetical protein [Casimicrobiaceae bacterium]
MSRTAAALGLSPARHAWVALVACLPLFAQAAPLTRAEIEVACTGAEDTAHCGRLIEALQLARLPGLARRTGNALIVSLFPSGSTTFTDSDDPVNGRSYSLWDYFDGINSVVLYVTVGDNASFSLLQRATGRLVDLPAEPRLSPDRQRFAVADVCAQHCGNEIAVWRVTRDGFRKELRWTPATAWSDAGVTWRDADTLTIEFNVDPAGAPSTIARKLTDPTWTRIAP